MPEQTAVFMVLETMADALACKKRADALKAQLGLPLAGEDTVGAYLIADGNNNPIGKISVFHKDSFVMPETWQARIS